MRAFMLATIFLTMVEAVFSNRKGKKAWTRAQKAQKAKVPD